MSIFRQIIIFIPLAYALMSGLDMGVLGAWLAYPISDMISFITAAVFIKYTYTSLEILERHQIVKYKTPNSRLAHDSI